MRIVRAAGSHYEIGRSCGEQCAQEMRQCMQARGIPERYAGEEHRAILARIEANVRRIAPDLWAELEGVADGSGIPLPDVLLLNSISSLNRSEWAADAQAPPACTGIGFADTPEGVIIGKTNDGGGTDAARDDVPHCLTFPNGRRALFMAWPGTVWAWAWVNDAGLASNGSSVGSRHFNPEGIPGQMVTRLVLEHCRDVPEALELMRDTPFVCEAAALTMGDAQGNLVAAERDVHTLAVREAEDGVVFTANAWFSPELRGCDSTDPAREVYLENSRHRFANLQRRTREVPHTIEGMQTLLRDHTHPGAICQHPKDNAAHYNTYNAFVMLPRRRAILVAGGRACEEPFTRLDLPG